MDWSQEDVEVDASDADEAPTVPVLDEEDAGAMKDVMDAATALQRGDAKKALRHLQDAITEICEAHGLMYEV